MTDHNRPNILVILSDQLRRDALGIYGDPNVATPNIDRLAREGVRFTNACSTYPVCVPFRFTLMTGEYAHSRFVPEIEWRMSPAERTLADEFNDAGYETIYTGKWHLYGGHAWLPGHSSFKANRTPVPREHQGRWQKWFGFELANRPFDTCYFIDDDPTPHHIDGYQTDGLFDLTMDHIRDRNDDRPFCAVLSVEPPHPPLEAPEEFEARWRERDIELPPNFLVPDERPAPGRCLDPQDPEARKVALDHRRMYYALIENLDMNVGRLLDFVDKSGLRDNTIIMLVADHGEADGAHCRIPWNKQDPYEESVGIPLIIRDPRVPQHAGDAIPDATCTEDLFPTLLGLAGLEPRDPKPGANLTPLIHGEIERLPREGVLLENVHDLRNNLMYHEVYWRAFRTRRTKYTVLGGAEGGQPWQFFDLENDPYEMHNLIDDPASAEEVRRHHQLLRERLVETGDHYVLAPAFGIDGLNLWQE